MRPRSLLLLTVVPFLATACSRPDDAAATSDSAAGVAAASTADAGEARQAIEASNTKFVDAVKRSDSTTVADNYTDDAIVMASGTEAWRGRDAVRKGFTGMMTQAPAKEFSLKTDDVMVGGDLAVETGSYEMTVQPKGGKEMKDKGKYVVVWKRQADGSWKIVRDIFNSDVPPKG
jgi:uncharacterized protein (TIGR02246 family)